MKTNDAPDTRQCTLILGPALIKRSSSSGGYQFTFAKNKSEEEKVCFVNYLCSEIFVVNCFAQQIKEHELVFGRVF